MLNNKKVVFGSPCEMSGYLTESAPFAECSGFKEIMKQSKRAIEENTSESKRGEYVAVPWQRPTSEEYRKEFRRAILICAARKKIAKKVGLTTTLFFSVCAITSFALAYIFIIDQIPFPACFPIATAIGLFGFFFSVAGREISHQYITEKLMARRHPWRSKWFEKPEHALHAEITKEQKERLERSVLTKDWMRSIEKSRVPFTIKDVLQIKKELENPSNALLG